jgi:hypothetical protein
VNAAELFAALMSADTLPEVSRLAARHLRPGRPAQWADVGPLISAVQREHLRLPTAGPVTNGQVYRALITHTDTEEAS